MGKSNFIRFNVSLSEDTFNALGEFCSDYQFSRSTAINFAIKRLLKETEQEQLLQDSISKLTTCLLEFSCRNKLSAEEVKQLDDVLLLCNASSNLKS